MRGALLACIGAKRPMDEGGNVSPAISLARAGPAL
jgi:hypothetical protein